MKCEICEAITEDLEIHYKEQHPNRISEYLQAKEAESKSEPEPEPEPVKPAWPPQ